MTRSPSTPGTSVPAAQAVQDFFGPLLASLRTSGDAIAPLFDAVSVSAEEVLRVSRPFAFDVLQDPHTVGAGFVVSPGLLADETYLLAWWQGDDKERIPESAALVQSTDYSRQEWFRTPVRTGRSHVTGPYIDYVCTDEFVLTLTVPVVRAERTLGVMGVDVLAETIERALVDVFRAEGATLVNHHDRAVLSGDPRVFAGDPVNRAAYATAAPCDGLPFTVLT